MKITKEMSFTQLLEICPEAGEVLFSMGMGCVGCPMAAAESIEQGCKVHGMDPDEIVERLNALCTEKKD